MERIFRRPAALGVSAFFVCAVAMSYCSTEIRFITLALSAVLFIGTVIFYICKRRIEVRYDRRLAVICLCSGLVIGSLFSAFAFGLPADFCKAESGGITELRGTVLGKMWSSGSYSAYKLRVDTVGGEDLGFTLFATATDASLEVGDIIRAEGEVLPLEDADMVDMERYLRSEGIVGFTEIDKIVLESVEDSFAVGIAKLRLRLSGKITTFVDGEGGAFVNALVTGDRSGLSGTSRLDFERLGIAHLLAISGIHLSVIFAFLSVALTFTSFGKRRGAAVLIPFILIYMGLSGFSPSVVRAGTMLIIGCVLQSFGRRRDSFSVLAVSVAAIAFADPNVFFDTGFILSVLSVCGVLWFTALRAKRTRKDRHIAIRILLWILTAAAVTLATSLFTLPIIILEFGYVSAVAPVANIIFIPLVTGLLYMVPLLIFTLPLPPVAMFFGDVIGAYADMILDLADRAAASGALTVSVRYPFFLPLSILAIIGAVLVIVHRPKRVGVSLLALCCVLGGISAGSVEASRRDTASVTALSGSGGDMLCVTDGAEMMLIDMTSGTSQMIFEGIAYAAEARITEIDHYVLTHYHSRHVTMVQTLLSEVYVGTLWLPDPIGREELEISVDVVNAALSAGTQVRMIDGEVEFGEVTYTPGKRCWTSRSVEAVHSARISAHGKSAVYYSAGYWDVSEDFRALSDHGDADVLIYGGHGPKYLSEIVPPDNAETMIFLGNSADHFPAADALTLFDGGCVIEDAGYTVWWGSPEWESVHGYSSE